VKILRKALFSLFIALILSAAFAVAAFTGLFDLVEARFYNPSAGVLAERELKRDAEAINAFFTESRDAFAAQLSNPALRRSFLPVPASADIHERDILLEQLLESRTGLLSVRFIDAGGSRVRHSTLKQDLLDASYRDYEAGPGNPPYTALAASPEENSKIIFDENGETLFFSFPFYDSLELYRGTAVFTLSVRSLSRYLAAAGRVKIGEEIALISTPPGIVLDLPASYRNRNAALARTAAIWENLNRSSAPAVPVSARLDISDSSVFLDLFSLKTAQGIYAGRLFSETLFIFSPAMKALFLAAFFITAYLTVFLLFNLRQDPLSIVRSRLNSIRTGIMEAYRRKGERDWALFSRELEGRREDVRQEIKRQIHCSRGEMETEIDRYFDAVWDELIAQFRGQAELAGTPGKMGVADISAALKAGPLFPPLEELEAEEDAGPSEPPAPPVKPSVQVAPSVQAAPPVQAEETIPLFDDAEALEIAEEIAGPGDYLVPGELMDLEDLEEFEELEESGFQVVKAAVKVKTAVPAKEKQPHKDSNTVTADLEFIPAAERPEDEADLEPLEPAAPMNLLSGIFNFTPSETGEPESLVSVKQISEQFWKQEKNPAEPVIENRNGVDYINKIYLAPNKKPTANPDLDKNFKTLVDSVLGVKAQRT
jgi:hypothetical protein